MDKEKAKYLKMRLAGKIILYVFASLLALLMLIYVFIDARMLFAGDFMAYSSPNSGLLSLILSLISNIFIAGYSIYTIVLISKKEIKNMDIVNAILTITFAIITIMNVFTLSVNRSHGLVAYLDLLNIFVYCGFLVGGFFFYVFTYHYLKDPEEGIEKEEEIEEINESEI